MKTGKNQHYIPQFLLRGFGKRRKERGGRNPYFVNVCNKDKIYSVSTAKIGTANYFNTAKGDQFDLDEVVTRYETDFILPNITKFREIQHTRSVDKSIASKFVFHLMLRTEYVRTVILFGMRKVVTSLLPITLSGNYLYSALGLGQEYPAQLFIDNIELFINENNIQLENIISKDALIKVLFYFMRENFEDNFRSLQPTYMEFLFNLYGKINEIVQDGHKKALFSSIKRIETEDYLEKFSWQVYVRQDNKFILPDCVGISVDMNSKPSPFMFADKEAASSVIVALDCKRLLVGSRNEFDPCDIYNHLASACSDKFFIFHPDNEEINSKGLGAATCHVQDVICSGINSSMKKYFECDITENYDDCSRDIINFSIQFISKKNDLEISEIVDCLTSIVAKTSKHIDIASFDGFICTSEEEISGIRNYFSEVTDEYIAKKIESLKKKWINIYYIKYRFRQACLCDSYRY